ncbi:hypothetical protein P3S68_000956 [Capsicum galapagoense]
MCDIGKKARASLKGGSLHTSGARSQGNVRRKLEKELGRPITQDGAFKATHTRKKKTPQDPDVWVDPRAQLTYELEGVGSFQNDESRETILDLKQQIAELSSKAKASQARERQRDIQYAGMKAQFDALLASAGIPPCPDDVVRPPRPPQSLPISHGVYGQYRDVTEDPTSDEDDEDYYVDNTPPRY